jgi:O-antigen ligase
MSLILNLFYFAILIVFAIKYLNVSAVPSRLKFNGEQYDVTYTGLEAVLILIIVTGITGFLSLLAVHLAFAELICVIVWSKAPNKPIFSVPIKLFLLFIAWALIGLFYTPSVNFGSRMILKYLYAPLIALATSAVVDNLTVFLKAAYWGRRLALLSFIVNCIPVIGFLFPGVFWNRAALATNYIIWVVFSFALYTVGVDKKRNLIWGVFFILPCLIWAFRTDIFGTSVALAAFFFIKYRLKSLPLIFAMAVLAVCSLFFIPSIKSKMYFHPDQVTVMDFLTNNVDENNVNTSGRNEMWKKVTPFYEEHPAIGSGTGRVQKYFYTEIMGFGRGGQLHNELLLIKCDNGMIGLVLFLASYIAVLLHCVYLYHKSDNEDVKLCSLTSGAALFGILVTLYSDNTVSYSLTTLGIPWAFYGMALGINRKESEPELIEEEICQA